MRGASSFWFIWVMCAACIGSAPESEGGQKESGFMDGTIRSSWAPLAADESYEGKSLAEWGVQYSRWSYAQTSCDSPAFDQEGSLCGLYQDPESPVFFLDYSPTKRLRTKCRIPVGKAIVIPIMTFSNDNAGVEPPKSNDELIQMTVDVLESMRDLKLRVDGKTIHDIAERKIEPTKYEYTLPPAPNWYACNGMEGVEGITVDPSYFAGYVAVFPPPEPGVHELQYAGVLSFNGDEYPIDTRTRFIVEK